MSTPDLPAAILEQCKSVGELAFRAGADHGAAEIARLNKVNAQLVEALTEINRDAWSDDKTRMRVIARTSDAALKLAADPGAKGEG